ncbi:MAG TPA: hypothetical protein VND83_10165 [Acidimicrobiales bacterium]|nr:hypothetical protein [Acidimicrobiales bacterium]
MANDDQTGPATDPIKVFLSQPAEVADEDRRPEISGAVAANEHPSVSDTRKLQRFGRWFSQFMFEKKPSGYSSIAPRRSDGTRVKIFWFNGNGRGR